MKKISVKCLPKEIEKKLHDCSLEIASIMDEYFPEVRSSWDIREPNSFDGRVFTAVYLELIYAGFFSTTPRI